MFSSRYLIPVLLTLFVGPVGLAQSEQNPPSMSRQQKIQMHENMAKMHQKAAECLKAGKSEQTCKTQMMSMCEKMQGNMNCPMMAQMGHMHQQMHGQHTGGMMEGDSNQNPSSSGQTGQPSGQE